MTVALYVLGFALILAGLVGLVVPAMPGAPLIFAGLLSIAWADGFTRIGVGGLLLLGGLTVVISVVDYLAGVVGARRFGASAWGIAGALAGLIVGLFLGLPGLILGPVVGALLFEYLKDPNFERAARVGVGTLVGFVVGTAVKYALAFIMLGLAVVVYIFP